MKPTACAILMILWVSSLVFAGTEAILPANSRIFLSEETCIEVLKARYSWNIEFSASLDDMEEAGKLIRYPHSLPIMILEKKNYKSRDYHKISIVDRQIQKQQIVWTDAVRFE